MTPPAPVDGGEAAKDALSTILLALSAMAARLGLSKDKVTAWAAAGYTFAAIFTGWTVGRATAGRLDDGLRDCAVAVCAYAAPEVLRFLLRLVTLRGRRLVRQAEGRKKAQGRPGSRRKA